MRNKEQYNAVTSQYPLLGGLYSLVKDFHSILFSKKTERLSSWIERAESLQLPELKTYLDGTIRDIDAVKNSIIYPYSNGLAEGSVNKIKVIKRIMYGRNSFQLLIAKVLLGEVFHEKNN